MLTRKQRWTHLWLLVLPGTSLYPYFLLPSGKRIQFTCQASGPILTYTDIVVVLRYVEIHARMLMSFTRRAMEKCRLTRMQPRSLPNKYFSFTWLHARWCRSSLNFELEEYRTNSDPSRSCLKAHRLMARAPPIKCVTQNMTSTGNQPILLFSFADFPYFVQRQRILFLTCSFRCPPDCDYNFRSSFSLRFGWLQLPEHPISYEAMRCVWAERALAYGKHTVLTSPFGAGYRSVLTEDGRHCMTGFALPPHCLSEQIETPCTRFMVTGLREWRFFPLSGMVHTTVRIADLRPPLPLRAPEAVCWWRDWLWVDAVCRFLSAARGLRGHSRLSGKISNWLRQVGNGGNGWETYVAAFCSALPLPVLDWLDT